MSCRDIKFYLIVLVLLIFIDNTKMYSQQIIGDVVLSSQAEIDAFVGTSITGRLTIQESVKGNIRDLTSLTTLISIGGDLWILDNVELPSLNGLKNIKSIGGGLAINGNARLTDINEIENITTVIRSVFISNNLHLTNIDGLKNIKSISQLHISYNPVLSSLEGLQNISSIQQGFVLADNSSLTNVDGLRNLKSVIFRFTISNNNSLTNLDGLSGLNNVSGDISLSSNSNLTNLDGLSNLYSVTGNLTIQNNSTLNEFCGIFPLLYVGGLAGTFTLTGNAHNPTIEEILANKTCIPSGVCIGDVKLATQVEVDGFNCKEITGNLEIGGENSNITDLSPLLVVTTIRGNLLIEKNQELTNIDGLSNIQSVGGEIKIYGNAITNIDGLRNIVKIDQLNILYNHSLISLEGLKNISSIANGLSLVSNNYLSNVDGLRNITSVTKFLNISNNINLTNIEGLRSLTNAENIIIEFNSQLANLNGLSGLNNIIGGLKILSNPALLDLDGLNNITSISGELDITSNPLITNLEALKKLIPTFNGSIQIRNNNSLTNIEGLIKLTSINGSLRIISNPSLTNLDGLNNISKIDELLVLIDNPMIKNLDPLGNLERVSSLSIDNNFKLMNFDGLKNITYINGSISIEGNPSLTNIDGLMNITGVRGVINIVNNLSLTNIDGLMNVSYSIGGLQISGSPLIKNIDALNKITLIQSSLYIADNFSLTNLDGLSRVSFIRNTLSIKNNSSLKNLDGLRNIDNLGWLYNNYRREITVTDNSVLDNYCGLYPILRYAKGIEGSDEVITIMSNLINPTTQQILDEGPCYKQRVVSYEIIIPDCDDSQNPLLVKSGEFVEGSSFSFPQYTLPPNFAVYQQFYDFFVGVEFGIPEGSLNEDVKISINLQDFCNNGIFDNADTKEILELLYLSIEVIGSESGIHSPLKYYYFNDGKEAFIKIPLSNISLLLKMLNYNIEQVVAFFTKNGLNPDFKGIRVEITNTYFIIYTTHFSELKLGILNSPTDLNNNSTLPTEFSLDQNYPNPFNPSTSISYSIPSKEHVTLSIYDILGNTISVLENGYKSAGTYSYSFDASNLTSGIYFYTIKAGSFASTKKMLLIK